MFASLVRTMGREELFSPSRYVTLGVYSSRTYELKTLFYIVLIRTLQVYIFLLLRYKTVRIVY
jgi:hypothetical protein